MKKRISVSSNKGGILKTTLCANLSVLLSKKYKVLFIDADNQGNGSITFSKNPDQFDNTLFDVLLGNCIAKDAIYNVSDNLDILPSNGDLSLLEFNVFTNLKTYPQPYQLLKRGIESVENDYDYIIVDSPPNIGLVQSIILTYVNQVLIPFQPEGYSMRSLIKIKEAVEDFKEDQNDKLEILGVVHTLVDTRTSLHGEVMELTEKFCEINNINVFKTFIPRAISNPKSIYNHGKPITLTNPKDKQSKIYKNLLGEMMND